VRSAAVRTRVSILGNAEPCAATRFEAPFTHEPLHDDAQLRSLVARETEALGDLADRNRLTLRAADVLDDVTIERIVVTRTARIAIVSAALALAGIGEMIGLA
jgi:hypothetical protein